METRSCFAILAIPTPNSQFHSFLLIIWRWLSATMTAHPHRSLRGYLGRVWSRFFGAMWQSPLAMGRSLACSPMAPVGRLKDRPADGYKTREELMGATKRNGKLEIGPSAETNEKWTVRENFLKTSSKLLHKVLQSCNVVQCCVVQGESGIFDGLPL